MGKHDHVWHISSCLGDYIGVQVVIPVCESKVSRAAEELRSKYIRHSFYKGVKPFYRRGVSKRYQNLGAIQYNTV